jgi:hypothetical protein
VNSWLHATKSRRERAQWGWLGLAEDPSHLGATRRADSLGEASSILLFDVTVEGSLLLAFHAVRLTAVLLGHDASAHNQPVMRPGTATIGQPSDPTGTAMGVFGHFLRYER